MGPFGWIRFGLEAGKALIDLYKASALAPADEAPERTNPEKAREQAAGASANSEAKAAGRVKK